MWSLMTKLKRYVASERGRISRLAEAAGVSPAQIHRIVHGSRRASLAVAVAIAKETGGVISPDDVAAAFIAREPEHVSKVNTAKGKKKIGTAARASR